MGLTHLTYEAEAWGVGELWLDGGRLVWHELPRPAAVDARGWKKPRLQERSFEPYGAGVTTGRQVGGETAAGRLAHRLRAYFAGEPDGFDDVELELSWCTPFQRAALEALRSVPRGETVTYGELAALAGHPNAHRAAGSFCARNRFPLIVPCHRVVAAGGLGSYGSLGLDYKRRLLLLEGAA